MLFIDISLSFQLYLNIPVKFKAMNMNNFYSYLSMCLKTRINNCPDIIYNGLKNSLK